MKVALKIILLLAVAGYLIFALVKFARPSDERVCLAVDIEIEDSLEGDFVTSNYIYNILTQHKISAEGQKISQVNIGKIEEILEKDPYIATATCYYTAASHLCISVLPQHPIIRIASDKGENYYMDKKGNAMPANKFNIDMCIFTGNIDKEFAKRKLAELSVYINEHEFWSQQIAQIHVINPENIELHPRVGNHTILLGGIENFRDKLNRLFLFYKKGLPQVGWNKYETINLSYNGQIVCTKKGKQTKN